MSIIRFAVFAGFALVSSPVSLHAVETPPVRMSTYTLNLCEYYVIPGRVGQMRSELRLDALEATVIAQSDDPSADCQEEVTARESVAAKILSNFVAELRGVREALDQAKLNLKSKLGPQKSCEIEHLLELRPSFTNLITGEPLEITPLRLRRSGRGTFAAESAIGSRIAFLTLGEASLQPAEVMDPSLYCRRTSAGTK